jgi:hypothetical protein
LNSRSDEYRRDPRACHFAENAAPFFETAL